MGRAFIVSESFLNEDLLMSIARSKHGLMPKYMDVSHHIWTL